MAWVIRNFEPIYVDDEREEENRMRYEDDELKEYIVQTVSESQADNLRKQALKGMDTWWCGADFALDMMRKYKVFEQWDTEDLMYRPFDYDELNEWLEWAYEEYYGEDY